MENKQLTEISYLRALAIFLVVLMHCFSPYLGWKFVHTEYAPIYRSIFSIWMGARMPLFLFISGYLFSYLIHDRGKYQHVGWFTWNKVKRLLIPYFIFTFLMMLSHGRIINWDNFEWVPIKLIYFQKGYWHLWFLLTLFLCFVITRPVALIKHPAFHIIFLLFVTFLNVQYTSTIKEYVNLKSVRWGVDFLVLKYVFFYWGYLISRYKENFKFLFKWKTVIILLVVWFSLCFVRDYFGIPNVNLKNIASYITSLTFIIAVYAGVSLLVKNGKLKELPFVGMINKYSYGIYIFHVWIITYLFFRGKFFTPWIFINAKAYPVLFPILLFLFVAVFSTVFTHLLLKIRVGRFLIG